MSLHVLLVTRDVRPAHLCIFSLCFKSEVLSKTRNQLRQKMASNAGVGRSGTRPAYRRSVSAPLSSYALCPCRHKGTLAEMVAYSCHSRS